jgi:hypothetical protein
LIANNRLDEAQAILQRFAVNNGVNVDAHHLSHMIRETKEPESNKETSNNMRLLDLVLTPKLRKRTIISTFNW